MTASPDGTGGGSASGGAGMVLRLFEGAMITLKYGLGVLLLAGVALNFTNVCLRYLFGSAIRWTEEIMVFGLLLCVLGGTVIATAFDRHLKIDVVMSLLGPLAQRALKVLAHLLLLAVTIYLARQSFDVVSMMMNMGQRSMAARVPMWIPHSFVLVCFALSALAALYAIYREFRPAPVAGDALGTTFVLPPKEP